MSRTFQDRNFLVWEVYPSSGKYGFSDHPHLVFHCLTKTDMRPRWTQSGADEADAERQVEQATDDELVALLEHAQEIE